MPAPIETEEDETLLYQQLFSLKNNSTPFGIAISNKGVYKLKSKLFAMSDPYYFDRINKDDIFTVEICRRRTIGLMAVSFFMIIIGIIIIWYLLNGGQLQARGIGYGIATLATGIIMPFVLQGRYALRILGRTDSIKWIPPLALDKTTKNLINNIFDSVAFHAKSIGLDVLDKRPTNNV